MRVQAFVESGAYNKEYRLVNQVKLILRKQNKDNKKCNYELI